MWKKRMCVIGTTHLVECSLIYMQLLEDGGRRGEHDWQLMWEWKGSELVKTFL